MLMRLDQLFDVANGVAASALKIHNSYNESRVALIRPSNNQMGTIAGWVEIDDVPAAKVYPPETVFVSTNGEGSHTFSYVSDFDFVPNSDVCALIPKLPMSRVEKIFYASCITANRYRFSYGRKPKGERLKSLLLPETPPAWLVSSSRQLEETIDDYRGRAKSDQSQDREVIRKIDWGTFLLGELFDIRKGKRLTRVKMTAGNTPYVGASDKNNGITAWIGQDPIHSAGTITVAYDGSVGEAFYQHKDYWASDAVNVLYPNFEMTPEVALFIAAIIRREKYRFSYGRKWHLERMRESRISLPTTPDGTPDIGAMSAIVQSLPFSSAITPLRVNISAIKTQAVDFREGAEDEI